MFAIFGLGWAEIVVLAVMAGIVVLVIVSVKRRANASTNDDQATQQRLRDKIDELRAENNRLREENDRLRESGVQPVAAPADTGIKPTAEQP